MHLPVETTVQNMDFGEGEFEIKILNTNEIVQNMEQFIKVAGEYV